MAFLKRAGVIILLLCISLPAMAQEEKNICISDKPKLAVEYHCIFLGEL